MVCALISFLSWRLYLNEINSKIVDYVMRIIQKHSK